MIFPTSPTASSLSSQLPSPLSPVFILQPPPLSSPLKNQAFVPSSFPPPITPPGAPVPTKTKTHCFCNHSALRQLSYNCNASVCAVTLSMVWRVTLDNTRFWEDEFLPEFLLCCCEARSHYKGLPLLIVSPSDSSTGLSQIIVCLQCTALTE